MPVHLAELEAGFHPDWLGFPSIQGCMAIVAVCESGLFGYHNPPSNQMQRQGRSRYFAQYYNQHFMSSPITRLYGITHVYDRSYGVGARAGRQGLRAELVLFAGDLGFTGPLRGVDLVGQTTIRAGTAAGRSAYVEVRKDGHKGKIYFKDWNDGLGTKGQNVQGNRLRHVHDQRGVSHQPLQVFTTVDRSNLRRLHSTRLRG